MEPDKANDETTQKKPRKTYKRSSSTIYVLTPVLGDTPLQVKAGPFPTIKKAKAAITEPGAYDIVCLREQVEVVQKTMTLFKNR